MSKVVRILHVAQPTTAGVANVLLGYVTEQVGRGMDVHVAAPSAGYLLNNARERGATVHVWEATRSPGPTVPREVLRLRSIILNVAPDVLHLHSSKAGLAGRLADRGRIPTIFQPHAWSFEAVEGALRIATVGWERAATRFTSITLCVSDAEATSGHENKAVAGRVEVVPNGIDLVRFSPGDPAVARQQLGLPDDALVAVCVGRFAHQKGQDVLLRAWPTIVQETPHSQLALVGDVPKAALRALQPSVRASVHLYEGLDPALAYLAADVVVVPSRWEGMPLVVLEAMATGRSIVATRVTGVADATGPGSHLVAPQDPQRLAEAIILRLRDGALRQQEASAHLVRVRHLFDEKVTAARVAEIAEDLGRRH